MAPNDFQARSASGLVLDTMMQITAVVKNTVIHTMYWNQKMDKLNRKLIKIAGELLHFPSKKKESTTRYVVNVGYDLRHYPRMDKELETIADKYGGRNTGSGAGGMGRDVDFEFSTEVDAHKFVSDINKSKNKNFLEVHKIYKWKGDNLKTVYHNKNCKECVK